MLDVEAILDALLEDDGLIWNSQLIDCMLKQIRLNSYIFILENLMIAWFGII
jgi:endonuclease V-like protein UPF0215 family